MTAAGPIYRSRLQGGRENFMQLVHAEWTKLRSVRGWMISLALGAGLTIGMSVLVVSGAHTLGKNGKPPSLPTGPGGEPVADTYYFVHQGLAGDGTITGRVTSLVGALYPVGTQNCRPGAIRRGYKPPGPKSGSPEHCAKVVKVTGQSGPSPATLQPWAKAGLIITASTAQGSPYAAVLVTPAHGVRMQWDYTNDRAGLPGAVSASSPRWLRLKRSGDTVTAFDSTDGKRWTTIDSAVLANLPSTVQVGLFVTAPQITVYHSTVAGRSGGGSPSLATATFDHVTLSHHGGGGTWRAVQVAPDTANNFYPSDGGGASHAGGTFRVSGSGDIAPWVEGPGGPGAPGYPLEMTLAGSFLGLLVIVVVAALFVTGEYRRGLVRTTLAARPRRGQVLAAKAIVIAGASLVVGLVAFSVDLAVGGSILRSNGNYIYPVSMLTQIRMVVGLSLLLAIGAVLALSIATVARRGAEVIAGLIVVFVLPPFLSGSAILPDGLAEWVLRVTPAAGFAIEQTLPRYFQVSSVYTPVYGYYPLSPWAGLLVLCAYAAAALGLAAYLFRRRDA
jgi:ABC-type transport system involved in multi-copper enzyme maturation permease subunit